MSGSGGHSRDFARVAQSALDPAGPQAEHIEDLWWLFFWICAVVFALVVAFLLAAVLRHRRRAVTGDPAAIAPLARVPETERRLTRAVATAAGVTVLLLFVLLVASVATGRALSSLSPRSALTIEVTGHQWWWEVEYDDPVPAHRITTANEIHIPVGRPVLVKGTSTDVIHSFWVPNLHGKKDLIPGYTTSTWLRADRPGVFHGQCAEFCGHQHAHMRLLVIAEPPERFAAWVAAQRQAATSPTDMVRQRGEQVFLSGPCPMCHTVRGTDAGGRLGPDLTHLASRRTLGAASMPNTRGHLAGWILDPQSVKPGNRMPPVQLGADDLNALLAYLEGLR